MKLLAPLAAIGYYALQASAVPAYGQCGGIGYTGSTICDPGLWCNVINPYYSQCLSWLYSTAVTSSVGYTTCPYTTYWTTTVTVKPTTTVSTSVVTVTSTATVTTTTTRTTTTVPATTTTTTTTTRTTPPITRSSTRIITSDRVPITTLLDERSVEEVATGDE